MLTNFPMTFCCGRKYWYTVCRTWLNTLYLMHYVCWRNMYDENSEHWAMKIQWFCFALWHVLWHILQNRLFTDPISAYHTCTLQILIKIYLSNMNPLLQQYKLWCHSQSGVEMETSYFKVSSVLLNNLTFGAPSVFFFHNS